MRTKTGVVIRVVAAFLVAVARTSAQDIPTQPDLQSRIRALEQELEALKQIVKAQQKTNELTKIEQQDQRVNGLDRAQQAADQKAAATPPPKITFDQRGLVFESADENFRLRLRGYIQADGRFYVDDSAHQFTDTFLLNRVRPVFEGTVFKDYDFKMMPDFGQGKAVIQDAYVDAHFLPWLNVQAGKYKGPVGLERLQSARDLIFVERSLPTDIAPNRDIGVWLHGDFLQGVLGYSVGAFNGAADGSSDDTDENDSKDIEGRLFAHPFKLSGLKPLEGFGFGIAGTTGHEDGTAPSYKTVGQQTFFSFNTGVTAQGSRDRISPQGYYYWGPFGLLGEYIISFEDVSKGTVHQRLANSAWQVTASYVLTGEKASYTGVVPEHPFNPMEGRWGALELAARVGQLDVDSAAFRNFGTAAKPDYLADSIKSASEAMNWGVGLNWYLNRDVKLMLDYDQTQFQGGAAHGNRPDEHSLFSRIQISF